MATGGHGADAVCCGVNNMVCGCHVCTGYLRMHVNETFTKELNIFIKVI